MEVLQGVLWALVLFGAAAYAAHLGSLLLAARRKRQQAAQQHAAQPRVTDTAQLKTEQLRAVERLQTAADKLSRQEQARRRERNLERLAKYESSGILQRGYRLDGTTTATTSADEEGGVREEEESGSTSTREDDGASTLRHRRQGRAGSAAAATATAADVASARELRTSQDSAYMQSLARDRAKEADRSRREAAAHETAEAERRAAELAVQQSEEAAAHRRALLELLPAEPSPDTDGACTVQLRLPDGTKARRVFPGTATVQRLYDWAGHLGFAEERHAIFVGFPRAALGDRAATLAASQLAGRTTLYCEVQL